MLYLKSHYIPIRHCLDTILITSLQLSFCHFKLIKSCRMHSDLMSTVCSTSVYSCIQVFNKTTSHCELALIAGHIMWVRNTTVFSRLPPSIIFFQTSHQAQVFQTDFSEHKICILVFPTNFLGQFKFQGILRGLLK